MRKLFVTAAAAIAMAAAPTVASAQQAATSAPTRAPEVQPAGEEAEGNELKMRGFILPLLLVVAIIVALTFLLDKEEQEIPTSP